jgi:hypothetical protein
MDAALQFWGRCRAVPSETADDFADIGCETPSVGDPPKSVNSGNLLRGRAQTGSASRWLGSKKTNEIAWVTFVVTAILRTRILEQH